MIVCDICKKEADLHTIRGYGLPRLELCEECYDLLRGKIFKYNTLAYDETCEERGRGKKIGLFDKVKMFWNGCL